MRTQLKEMRFSTSKVVLAEPAPPETKEDLLSDKWLQQPACARRTRRSTDKVDRWSQIKAAGRHIEYHCDRRRICHPHPVHGPFAVEVVTGDTPSVLARERGGDAIRDHRGAVRRD